MRVDDCRGQHLAGAVHNRALHAVAIARVKRERCALTCGGGEQHVAQVGLEHLQRALLGLFLQTHAGIQVGRHLQFRAPTPLHRLGQPGGVFHRKIETIRNHALKNRLVARVEVEREYTFVLPAKQRQNAVAGQFVKRLREVEVVRELRAFLLLALNNRGAHGALFVDAVAHGSNKVGVGGEPVHQNRTSTVECSLRVRESFGEVPLGEGLGGGGGVVDKQLRQILKTRLAGDIRLSLATLLVRQVQVFDARLRIGCENLAFEIVGKFALLLNTFEHRGLALSELDEVDVALLNVAQLPVVEPTGGFLAVAGNERHGVALGEQFQRLLDLRFPNVEFVRDGDCD